MISLERTQPCPDSAAAPVRLGQVGPQSQEPRAGGGLSTLHPTEQAEGGCLWLSPLGEGLGWRGSKRRSCFPCLLIKRTGFGQGGSCRCLQNKGGGERPEASVGPGVNAVPVRLVWARPCPEAGREGMGALLAATARWAGKLERGAHLVRRHLGCRSRLGPQALPTCPRQRTACHHSDGTEV